MEFNYTIFNPEKSKTAQMLYSLNTEDVFKRYLEESPKTFYSFKDDMYKVVNLTDDEGYLIYTNINNIAIDALKDVVGIIGLKNYDLKSTGFKLNANNIIKDLDSLFGEFPSILNVLEFTYELSHLTTDILNFFTKEILPNSLFENHPFNNKN